MRDFKNINRDELLDAINAMLDILNIEGSDAGVYSIYDAILREQDKAKDYAKKNQI